MRESDSDRFLKSLIEFNSVDPIGSIYKNNLPANKKDSHFVSGKYSHQLVEIVALCLNPNHYHLILKQVSDNGVSEFMKRLGGGYTRYFNEKYKRNGVLFQGKFKSVHVANNNYLRYLSVYVNLNDKAHQLSGRTTQLVRTSWDEYVKNPKYNKGESNMEKKDLEKNLCSGKNIVLRQFKNKNEYKKFALETFEGIINKKTLNREFLLE